MKGERADLRHALADRVMSRVAGRGIGRAEVEMVSARVLEALSAARAATPRSGSVVATVTARSTPDLASRVRRDLEQAGIVIEEMGIGSAGRHTVVAVRLAAGARSDLERLAERSRWSLSFLDSPDLGASLA